MATTPPQSLITHEGMTFTPYIRGSAIRERVDVLAKAFAHDYHNRAVRLVCVEKGARFFCKLFTTALGQLDPSLIKDVDSVQVKSYEGARSSKLAWKKPLNKPSGHNIDVVFIEDIVDTGRTMSALKSSMYGRFASFSTVVLLDKPSARTPKTPFEVDYAGFIIPNVFVVGAGLDYKEWGRDLTDLYAEYTPDHPLPPFGVGRIHRPVFPV